MLVLVLGGASSGKSALAEEYCLRLGQRRLYVATMRPADRESRERVARHQRQRAGCGFDTVERYSDLSSLVLEKTYDCALLDCMGNLVANELFEAGTPFPTLADEVMAGIDKLRSRTGHLVVVTNAVFGGHQQYTGEMSRYVEGLGEINHRLAAAADLAVEAVCGLPLYLKGKGVLIT